MLVLNPAILKKRPQGFDWNTDFVGYYTFNDWLGNEIFSLNGGNSIAIGNNFSTDDFVESPTLNGNNSYYQAGSNNNPRINGNSVSIWVYKTNSVVGYLFGDLNGREIRVDDYNNIDIFNPDLVEYINIGYLNLDAWTHFVIQSDKVYINGSLAYEGSYSFSDPAIFGTNDYTYFAECYSTNRILTQQEVTQLYNNGTGLFYPN